MPEQGSRALGSRYELTERLGRGAMGEVWLGWDQQRKRKVAAKLLHRQFTQDTSVVGRFVQERSILMELRHPNIVEVIDLVVEGDDLAIVMEYVEGGSLGQYAKQKGTLPVRMAVSVTCGVLEAVAFAHSKGVLHRDIKPDNVLLAAKGAPSEKTARLSDFGIARIAQEESVRATGLLGTPAYMPPEMFESGIFSQASDVYAVGVMLYELLAGRTPFEGGGSPMAVGMRHVNSLPPALPVDERLWRVIDTMLGKDPALRLPAKDTLAALRELSPQLADQQLPVQPQPESWQDAPRHGQLGTNLHVQAMEGDVGATYIPGAAIKSSPTPTAGDVKAVISTGGGDTDGETMLAVNSSQKRTLDPTLESKAPELPQKKRRWWLIIGGGIVGTILVAIGIFFLVKQFPITTTAAPIVYKPGYAVGDQLPSGLRIDYDAKGGQEDNTVSLQITFTAAKESGLAGDVLQVFPQEAGQCPTMDASQSGAAVSPILKSKDGLDMPCGYRIPIELAAGAAQKIPFTVTGVAQEDLSSWISSIQQETSTALHGVTGSDFAIQRVTGIRVAADDVRMAGGTPTVPYTVFPAWPDQSDSSTADPLFTNSTLDFQATALLASLTGDEGFSRVSVTTCLAAQVVGHQVIAIQPNDNCEITVRVGALNVGQDYFSIRMAPS